ncbi:porin family protein [Pedobacter polaris]|uniref:Porin family protein n=1 Tax=Pedobacter polaris TaxID=2571273 RepID=A0A4U1CQU3_9SPHI|nr:porin family protein [Pedobacter polaris]TKC10044.1 porin family protein [Pedobacter polaris]
MKITTKILMSAFLIAGTLISSDLKAQTMPMSSNGLGFKIGIGAGAGIVRDSSPFSYGLGADVRLQLDLAPAVALTASGGYTRLMAKEASPFADYDFIPAVGGVKVFPIKRMYITGLLGAGFAIQEGSKTSFIFGGGTGYEWNNGLELSVRYEGYQQDGTSTTYQPVNGQYALRLGYNFKM